MTKLETGETALSPDPGTRRTSRLRLLLQLGVAIAFTIVLAVSLVYGRRNERMLDIVQRGHFPSVQTTGELSVLLTEIQRGLLDAAEAADPWALDHVDQTYLAFNQTLDRVAANPLADQGRVVELRLAIEQYYTLARGTTERMIQGETFGATAPALHLMKKHHNTAQALLEDSSRRSQEGIVKAFASSRRIQRTTMTVMATVIVACMVALLIGSFLSDRLIATRQRHEALLRHRAELEEEVGRRTQELTAATQSLVAAKDAAERAAAQNAELSRRNRMILDSAGEGIFGLDARGSVTFLNPAAATMLGWDLEEMHGRRFHDVIRCALEHVRPDESCVPWSTPHASNVRATEIGEFRTRDGRPIPVEYTANAIVGDDAVATGVVITFRDISERLAIEEMKSEFVSTVSHELRTPLTSIRGALGLLSSGLLGPVDGRGQRMLDIAVINTDRLIRLINDILDLERIEAGKIEIVRTFIAANDLMRLVVEGVQAVADQARVRLLIEPAETMLWVDTDRIVQTLTNLVSNAIKFSPPDGEVTVGGAETGEGFMFHVSDRGRGIPKDRLETIFERFKQVDASDSRQKGGSGLGLAICRSIVQAHGGRIWAESRDGGGSAFRFTLPTTPVHESSQGLAPRTLLVCNEDVNTITGPVRELLENSGFRVVGVPSTAAIAECAAKIHPDAIILDVASSDGWRIVEALEAGDDTRTIPLVVTAALDSVEGSAAHIANWVAKPVRAEALLEAVTAACAMPAILVVEDDLDLAGVMTASLQMHGIRTLHAATGQEAVAMCRRHEPNLIVLDIVLPDMDGFAVVDLLRNQATLRNVPLVVYSALDVRTSDQSRLRLGHTEFLTKSRVSVDEFRSKVMRLLQEVTAAERPIETARDEPQAPLLRAVS